DEAALAEFEAFITAQRADEPLPAGGLGYRHYRAIHRHLFQGVYSWAGRFRTVCLSKGESTFCYPEHIDREMRLLFAKLRAEHYLRGLDYYGAAARTVSETRAVGAGCRGAGRPWLARNSRNSVFSRSASPPPAISASTSF